MLRVLRSLRVWRYPCLDQCRTYLLAGTAKSPERSHHTMCPDFCTGVRFLIAVMFFMCSVPSHVLLRRGFAAAAASPVPVPSLGDSITEGTVVNWTKGTCVTCVPYDRCIASMLFTHSSLSSLKRLIRSYRIYKHGCMYANALS